MKNELIEKIREAVRLDSLPIAGKQGRTTDAAITVDWALRGDELELSDKSGNSVTAIFPEVAHSLDVKAIRQRYITPAMMALRASANVI